MEFHGIEFRPATSADMPQLVLLLEKEPEKILVRDEWLVDMGPQPFVEIIAGQYWIDEDQVPSVIHGFDRVTLQPAQARIVDNVFQYTNSRFLAWGMSPLSLRLYIPADTPTSA